MYTTLNERNELAERKISSRNIFKGKILDMYEDQVLIPNGNISSREVIRHKGAVCIIPITDDNKMIVERQFRYPIDEVITEIPAGKFDFIGEDPLDAAKRELREETGFSADAWTDLGYFYPAPAYCDEKITMFLAQGLHKGDRDLDPDEFIVIEAVPIAELVKDVMEGKIPDCKTQLCIMKAAKYLGV